MTRICFFMCFSICFFNSDQISQIAVYFILAFNCQHFEQAFQKLTCFRMNCNILFRSLIVSPRTHRCIPVFFISFAGSYAIRKHFSYINFYNNYAPSDINYQCVRGCCVPVAHVQQRPSRRRDSNNSRN